MRLVKIYAENLLSFGTGDEALDLALDPRLTVLVGPNGGGKSNVLRAIEAGLAPFRYHSVALTGPDHGPSDPLHYEIQVLKEWARQRAAGPVTVQCTVEWNTPEEHALWQAFLLACLMPATSHEAGLAQAGTHGDLSVDQLAAYAEALAQLDWNQICTPAMRQRLAWTFWPQRGTLWTRFHLSTLQPSMDSEDRFGQHWRWSSPPSQPPGPPVSVCQAYQQTFSSTAQGLWQGIGTSCQGQAGLPPLDWSQVLRSSSQPVAFSPFFVRLDAGHPWRDPIQWPSPLRALAAAMERVPMRPTDPVWWWRDCVAALLADHWLHVSHWTLDEPAPVTLGSSTAALHHGHLGLALLRLEGHGRSGRKAVQAVQDAFRCLTGAHLGFRLVAPEATNRAMAEGRSTRGHSPDATAGPAAWVQAICSDASGEVPIELSGSGRAQLALLLTAQHLAHAVIGLDEPERALYPSLQTQVMREWVRQLGIRVASDDIPGNNAAATAQTAADTWPAQLVLVTHSPYFLVPRPNFSVRYVHRPDHRATSRVVDLSPDDLRGTLRTPGDALWLFADRVVLVEGPHDAWVLQHVYQTWLAERVASGADSAPDPAAYAVLFWPAGGATAIASFAKVLQRLGTWWVALYDRDCCATQDDLRKAGRTAAQATHQAHQNASIWKQWADAQWSPADVKAMQHWDKMPWDARCQAFAAVQTANRRCLFFMGTCPDDNLERLAKAWDKDGYYSKGFPRLAAFTDALAQQLIGRSDTEVVKESVTQELDVLFQLCTV